MWKVVTTEIHYTSKCSALWGRSSRRVTVGFCMKVVEIGLAAHLRYIRPCTRTYVRTRATKGGLRPQLSSPFLLPTPPSSCPSLLPPPRPSLLLAPPSSLPTAPQPADPYNPSLRDPVRPQEHRLPPAVQAATLPGRGWAAVLPLSGGPGAGRALPGTHCHLQHAESPCCAGEHDEIGCRKHACVCVDSNLAFAAHS